MTKTATRRPMLRARPARRRRPMLRQQLRWWRTVYAAPRKVVVGNNSRRGR